MKKLGFRRFGFGIFNGRGFANQVEHGPVIMMDMAKIPKDFDQDRITRLLRSMDRKAFFDHKIFGPMSSVTKT